MRNCCAQYNETHNKDEQWPGLNFRGFNITDINTSEADRAGKIKEIVDRLNKKQDYVSIDSDSVQEAIEYNPNADSDTSDLIQNGFYTQRLADGMVADDNDTSANISEKTHESLKALANMSVSFSTEDFQSKEEAEKAYVHLESLQAIF